jgi:hypothetical protein
MRGSPGVVTKRGTEKAAERCCGGAAAAVPTPAPAAAAAACALVCLPAILTNCSEVALQRVVCIPRCIRFALVFCSVWIRKRKEIKARNSTAQLEVRAQTTDPLEQTFWHSKKGARHSSNVARCTEAISCVSLLTGLSNKLCGAETLCASVCFTESRLVYADNKCAVARSSNSALPPANPSLCWRK